MIQSLLSYFKSAPSEALVARIWLLLVVCNIISNIMNRFKSKNIEKKISNLQNQITEVKNSNNNTMESVQNKYIGLSSEQVIKLYKELRESDKELNKKFLSNKDFGKIFKILSKIIDNHNERLDALFKYIESVDRITDVLIEHTKKQDEYMINIPIIEIPEDWVVEIENNDK